MNKFKLIKPSCNLETVLDGRGGIFTWVPEKDIKEFNLLYFKAGANRGNHWHPEFTEYFLIVEGEGVMVVRDIETNEEQIIHMSKGQCSCAEPGIAHSFHAISPVTAVAMLSKPWDECENPIIHENVTEKRGAKTNIALFGSKGFVGSAILKSLKKLNYPVTEVTRENFKEVLGKEFDYVINAAMPSARFKAKNDPDWDFKETVQKTADIFYGVKFKKFIQISSISARCQPETVYGRNKLAAESIVRGENSLIIRLGPLFGEDLKKGVLIDMLNNSKVFVGESSKYAFISTDFVGDWIANNLDKNGLVELGAKNSLSLKELAEQLKIKIEFEGKEDNQEIQNADLNYPEVKLVIDFMKNLINKKGVHKIERCRFCGNSNIAPCINIGEQYLSSIFPKDMKYKEELKKYPLEIVRCVKEDESQCGSLQLAYDYNLSDMYKNYPYTSSSNSSMNKILLDVANSGKELKNLKEDDVVLDIGCNDGTLLNFFEDPQLDLIGIDPAQNIESKVNSNRFVRVKDFFSAESYKKATRKKAKLIFSIAMFYHLKDPVQFCKEMKSILEDGGAIIIQMAYLPAMIKTNMYDNIVHEHVGYYSLQNIKWILEKAGLEIFDVSLNDVYGGSFRIFAKKKEDASFKISPRVNEILEEELVEGVFKESTYSDFMERIIKTKLDLIKLIEKIKREGKNVWIYGASTKGNTIMQFCNIGADLIKAAADSNSFKLNKYLIGADIPIYSEEELRKEAPEYLLALPYSFVQGFIQREKELIKNGTKFIVPLPEVKILE